MNFVTVSLINNYKERFRPKNKRHVVCWRCSDGIEIVLIEDYISYPINYFPDMVIEGVETDFEVE